VRLKNRIRGNQVSISRREFLKTTGAAGAAVAGLHTTVQTAPGYVSPDWMGMLTDLNLCIGCRKCEWACNEEHGLPNQPLATFEDKTVFEKKRRTDANTFTIVNRFFNENNSLPVYVKNQCMHCIEPACASACLVKAFAKVSEGPVLYNKDVCIGCRYCMIACPFSIPTYEYSDPFTPEVKKCTMCFTRFTERGDIPACAKICPEEAITFGKRSDLIKLAREKIRTHPDRYVDYIYGEHEVGGTNWLYVSHVPFEKLDFKTDLGSKPFPELTKGFLSVVPLVLIIWPMLLMGAYTFSRNRKEGDTEENKK